MRIATILTVVLGLLASAGVAHALTAKQFVTRADGICKSRNAKLNKIKPPKTEKEIAAVLRRTLQISRPAQRRLEAIPLPKGAKRTTARQAVRLTRQGLNLLEATSRKIDRGANPSKTLQKAQPEAVRIAKRQSKEWRKLGSKHCAAR